MKLSRVVVCAAVLAAVAVWSGCGDTFRPVATPVNLQPGGNPQALRLAVTVGTNGAASGATSQINVPGDTSVGNKIVGRNPVHATFVANLALVGVVNEAASDSSISFYNTLATDSSSTTVTIAPNAQPVFVLGSGSNSTMYVANSVAIPVNAQGDTGFTVGVVPVSGATATTVKLVPLGKCSNGTNPPCAPASTLVTNGPPLALAQTVDGKKLYTANGDGSVSVISMIDNTWVKTITGVMPGACSAPWITPNLQNTAVYVVCPEAAQVSAIDTTNDVVAGTAGLPGGSNFVVFVPAVQRLYVANPTANAITVLDASSLVPTFRATIPITGLPAGSVLQKGNSIAPLPDGTAIYAIGSGSGTNCAAGTAQVSLINVTSNTVTACVNVGALPVSMAAATDATCSGPNGCKVYVAHQGAGIAPNASTVPPGTVYPAGTTVIRSSDNKIVAEIAAPNQDPNCISTQTVPCATVTPVFVTTSP